MKKCERCGCSFLTHRKVKLKDAYICGKCFKELGFGRDYYLISDSYYYDDIKDGYSAYHKKWRKEIMLKALQEEPLVTSSLDPKDLLCTEEERDIFDYIKDVFEDNGFNSETLEFKRLSKNYLTAEYNETWDIARFKFTYGAKWISFPVMELSSVRHAIESPDEVLDYYDIIIDSIKKASAK